MTVKEKLAALRQEMAAHGVQGYLVPREDEFMGEYVPACGERLAWVSGFTGSAGEAVVLTESAVVITNSIYEIQVGLEVDTTLFDRVISRDMTVMAKWIIEHAASGDVIGYDALLFTPARINRLQSLLQDRNIKLKHIPLNLVDRVWADRPPMPAAPVELFPETIAGMTAVEKRDMIAARVTGAGADAVIITESDSIAWLLNIRGNDVPHTPFALSYVVLHADGNIDWFIDPAKIPDDVRVRLGNHVHLHAPSDLAAQLVQLGSKHHAVMIDPDRSAIWFQMILTEAGACLIEAEDPCLLPKACKTPQEINAMRDAHVRDGVAIVKFLAWLDKNAGQSTLSEMDIVRKLRDFRALDAGFRDDSFSTIAGWGANAAIVHYRPTDADHARINPPGVLLLDSGGQYLEGTTDITRTIPIGAVDDEIRDVFTLVLKGHIGIASLRFPKGQTGQHMDVLARKALWAAGLDYGHGTGHGVGCYLSVHEEGGAFSPVAKRPIEENMVISNEPGYYKAGAYGIRIESVVRARLDGTINGNPALSFETLTLAPIDRRLINPALLDRGELNWLNEYHAMVYTQLKPYLSDDDAGWLGDMTAPIG